MNFIASTTAAFMLLLSHEYTIAANEQIKQSGGCGFSASAQFTESAPRDRFSIRNTSDESWQIRSAKLDLSTSKGRLIFDITAQGAGVEVFQPFRNETGEAILQSEPTVLDGQQTIELAFSSFSADQNYGFSIDVDDQLTESELGQIRVSGSEMNGATLAFDIINSSGEQYTISGTFNSENALQLPSPSC